MSYGHSHSLETKQKLSMLIRHRWKYQRAKMMRGHQKSADTQRGRPNEHLKRYREQHPEFYANLPKRPSTRRKISKAIKKMWKNPVWRAYYRKVRRYKRSYSKGYALVYSDNHPFADKKGRVEEHRLLMERKIGRFLRPSEVVHHRNGVKHDNRLDNLVLMSRSEHIAHHNSDRCIFDEKTLKEIKALYRPPTITMKSIAEKYNVSRTTIHRAIRGDNRKLQRTHAS